MAKFFGEIGFATQVETRPGIVEEQIEKRNYYGDVLRNIRRLNSSEQLNDDINVSNEISIIADAYANQNFFQMRYVVYMGVKWKVSSVDVQFPRLILTLGGVYNDDTE